MESRTAETVTTTEFLVALQDPASAWAWESLDRRYRPVLFRLGLRMGLHEDESADAAQESLLQFFQGFVAGEYRRENGRLGAWLSSIGRHRILDALHHARRRIPVGGASVIDGLEVSDPGDIERQWNAELEAEILRRAFEKLQMQSDTDERSVDMFRDHVLGGLSCEDVAQRYGVQVGTVYSVKSRCLKRLSALRDEVRVLYEDLA